MIGSLVYKLGKTKELIEIAGCELGKFFSHACFFIKMENGILISTLTSERLSYINKSAISNNRFYDYDKQDFSTWIKYISNPIYIPYKYIDTYFDIKEGADEALKHLQIDAESTNNCAKNAQLLEENFKKNFKSLLSLLPEEGDSLEIIEIIEKKNSLELRVKKKEVIMVAHEEYGICVDSFVASEQEDIRSIEKLFIELNAQIGYTKGSEVIEIIADESI